MNTTRDGVKDNRAPVMTVIAIILALFAALFAGFFIGRYGSVAPTPSARAQASAKAVTTTDLTSYISASEMWDKLDHSALKCEGYQTSQPPHGTYVQCVLSMHFTTLRTFDDPTILHTGPYASRMGKQLVITGQNWEANVTADANPEINKRLSEHVATVLGGKIVSTG